MDVGTPGGPTVLDVVLPFRIARRVADAPEPLGAPRADRGGQRLPVGPVPDDAHDARHGGKTGEPVKLSPYPA